MLDYFDDKDVFIFTDTKVVPARLYGNKEKTGARIEVFLLRELNEELRLWDVFCLLYTSRIVMVKGLVELQVCLVEK